MQSELWQVYKTIRSYQNMPKRPTLKPGRKRPSRNYPRRKPMFNECATSAFQRQGSDRYIGHWSLLYAIAASLILNIAISEPLLQHKQKVWSQIWSDKEF